MEGMELKHGTFFGADGALAREKKKSERENPQKPKPAMVVGFIV